MGTEADKNKGVSARGEYRQLIGSATPGAILILIDQSASMAEQEKGTLAANMVNRTIYEILRCCRSGEVFKDRCYVGVLGYGKSICPVVGGTVSQMAAKGIRMTEVTQTVPDDSRGTIQVKYRLPIWVEPRAEGGTPMATAFRKTAELIKDWAKGHRNSFPPVVINISGSEPDDFIRETGQASDTQRAAAELVRIETDDGNLLLFNAYISGTSSLGEILFPHNPDDLDDLYARFLFSISSVLPQRLVEQAKSTGLSPLPGARGLVFNAKAESFMTMLSFGSSVFATEEAWETALSETPPGFAYFQGMCEHLYENAQFTVYRPGIIQPQKWYTLLAFAHLSEKPFDAPDEMPHPLEEMERQARQILGDQQENYVHLTQDSKQPIPEEGEITFVPEIEGVEFNPSRRTFRWSEAVHREEFRLRAHAQLDRQTARGRMTVFLGVMLVADITLTVTVDSTRASGRPKAEKLPPARPYRNIFASYSHIDWEIVRGVANYAKAVGDRYLVDQKNLRSGETWSDQLKVMIKQADLFQLFWSSNSMMSSFVRNEWEYALSLGRPNFVRPCYWEEPLPQNKALDLPPPALGSLHFHQLKIDAQQYPVNSEAPELVSANRAFDYYASPSYDAEPLSSSSGRRRHRINLLQYRSYLRKIRPRPAYKIFMALSAVLLVAFMLSGLARLLPIGQEQSHQYAESLRLPDTSRNYSELIDQYEKSLQLARQKRDIMGEAQILNNLGNVYALSGQHSIAIEYYEKSLAMARQIGTVRGEAQILAKLGNIYAELGQNERAVECFNRSLERARDIRDAELEVDILDKLGGLFFKSGQYASALEFYRRAAEQGDAAAQYNLGLMYLNGHGIPQNLEQAVAWFTKAANQGFKPAEEELQKIRKPDSK